MKLKETFEMLIQFFNEIIAHVLPGAILLCSAVYIFDKTDLLQSTELHWVILIGASFLTGHAILSLNRSIERQLNRKCEAVISPLIMTEFKKYLLEYSRSITTSEEIQLSGDLSDMFYRNIAMSLSPDAGELGRRFMFISLFCKGASTCAGLIYIMAIIKVNMIISFSCTSLGLQCLALVIVGFFIYIMERRASEFLDMAMETPFSVAIVELIKRLKSSDECKST